MSRSVLLYGDLNLRYRDGSAIWMESIIDVLQRAGSEVSLVLKAFPDDEPEALGDRFGCSVLPPSADHRSRGAGMTALEAQDRILEIDAAGRFDLIMTRGYEIARALSADERVDGRLWPYITDGPAFSPLGDTDEALELARIAQRSRRIFVQTEDARSVFEATVPAATGKVLLLPPVVPDEHFAGDGAVLPDAEPEEDPAGTERRPLELVYSGKFARPWNSLEIPLLADRLAERGVQARVTMIGDKIQHSPSDRSFPTEMRATMARISPRVTWAGGMPRREALDLTSRADIGVSWRDHSLDSSLEISTKLLEYGALGVPPLLNRTRAHERLLGTDYPLFVDDDVLETLERAVDPQVRRRAAEIANRAAQPFRASRAAERLARYFSAQEPDLEECPPFTSPRGDGPLRVLFSSHDFKFSGELIDVLRQRDDIELRIDRWARLAHHDPEQSAADGDWADVIICEWAGHNAVFHSQRKRRDQRLIVRFHGFEVRGAWLRDVALDAVDAVVFVSDFYRREILEKTGWPEWITTVIPNVVDVIDLERDKLTDARFHLGVAGYVPMLKRPDRAVDLLERLLEEDDRFMLHLRGRAPWSYPWEWAKPLQRDAYSALFDRIRTSPELRSHVLFEDFSPDMGSWFRGIGWVLSPSTKETFHLAPVEGMASGAVPIVWDRPGATEIFGETLDSDIEEIAAHVLETVRSPGAFDALRAEALERAQRFDMARHRRSWLDLLVAERSTPLPLRGTPLADTVPDDGPRNPVHVAAVARRALDQGDSAGALSALAHRAVTDPAPHTREQLLQVRDRAQILEGLRTGRWIPVAGLGPVLSMDASGRGTVLSAEDVIGADTALGATAVLSAADALVIAARRERPGALRSGPDAAGTLATAMAARRLGLEAELTDAGRRAIELADADLPGLAEAFTSALERTSAPVDLDELTIGLVADRFTVNALSSTVRVVELPRIGWEQVLEQTPVDLILVESAWSSPGEDWFHGVAYHGDAEAADLRAILAHARDHGTPTLFWNREDPVHLRSFLVPAADFDTVLTSDARCIQDYQSTFPSRTGTVASLPFFAEPRVMHPGFPGGGDADAHEEDLAAADEEELRRDEARDGGQRIAFAGTYYGDRFPQRTRELRGILTAAARHGLVIYDRQAAVAGSKYRFPEELAPFSRGGVPADEMPEVYRRHPVHLNVNSVADSPTMFSRRVVEIAASGSVVLSGRGLGVATTLGEAFPVLSDEEEWTRALAELLEDPQAWRRAAWAQMRTVHRAFTSARSLALALRTAGLPVTAPSSPAYGVLVPLSSTGSAPTLLAQSVHPAVVAIASGDEDRQRYVEAGIRVVDLDAAAADLEVLGDVEWVGVLDPSVGPTHYEDLLLAAAFGRWDRLASRAAPATDAEQFSLSSGEPPPPGDVAGCLYRRDRARTAEDLVPEQPLRTYTWIRDDRATSDPSEGEQ